MQYTTEQNQNQNQVPQSIEEQVFFLQEQSRKNQAIQEELLAQQNSTQAMLAQLFNLVGSLQNKTGTAQTASQANQVNNSSNEDSPSPTYQRSSIKIKSPDKWSGPTDKLNIISWASSVRNYLKHYDLLNTPEGVTVVQSLLKGDAITYYVHQTETMCYEFETANKLLDQLIAWANPKYTQRNIRERIRNLRQHRNQPVFEYITAFQQLMFVVKNMSIEDQLINFSEGLVPRIKLEVAKAGDEITLDEAYRIAAACDETSNYAYRNSQNLRQSETNYRQPFQSNLHRGTPMDVDNFDRKTQNTRNHPSLSREEKEKLVKSNGCFYCRKNNVNHNARNCPEKRNQNDQHAVDLEPEDLAESTSEEDSEGYVIDANLVDSNDLKRSTDYRKHYFYINKFNFYEPLFDFTSECEITKTIITKSEKNELSDVPVPQEVFTLDRSQKRNNISKIEIKDHSDWQLNPTVAANIFKKWGEPAIDLFASHKNKQAPFYYRKPAPGLPMAEGCIGEDAFSISWDMNNTVYCNPPWTDISLVIEKIIRDKPKKIIVIAPKNKRLDELSNETINLRHTTDLFIPQSRQKLNTPRGVGLPTWNKTFAYLITNNTEITK